jgi:large subunit ribosomal protein L4
MSTSALLPLITSRNLFKLNPLQKPLQAWVETLSQIEDQKVGIVDLHPSVFAVNPRYLIKIYPWTNIKQIDSSLN